MVYTLDREPRWVLKVGPQDAHRFEWELFALSLDSWPQLCRRFTLQVEVPGLPAQDLRAYTVELDGGPSPPDAGRFIPPDVHYDVLLVWTSPSGGVPPSPRPRGA